MPEVRVSIDVAAPAEVTWARVMSWEQQGEWIPATRVRVTHGRGDTVGDRVVARTALWFLGFDDPMEITGWDPPRRCDVRHLGRVVRGTGTFEVVPAGADRSRFLWLEQLDLPLGRLGEAGFRVIRPVVERAIRVALRRMARTVERG